MNQTTHTPGPWAADIRRNQTGIRHILVTAGEKSSVSRGGIKTVWKLEATHAPLTEEDAANARLIAAAPAMRDLLDTLATEALALITNTPRAGVTGSRWMYENALKQRVDETRALLATLDPQAPSDRKG